MLSDIIALDPIPPARTGRPRMVGCPAKSCGAPGGRSAWPTAVWERLKDHPCYNEDAHHYFARMHVAVAPACNMQCNYCNRKFDCANESRPGVTSETLSPEQAARKALAVAAESPQLSVLGIAGPGDSLFDWRRTFETFQRVEKVLPGLKFCLSTNGLALPDHVDRIVGHNIDHVTITINMVDPTIGAAIYAWVFYRGRRYTGVAASRLLHERQMEGLQALTARGILVKVNSVMIPGINDHHLAEVNATVTAHGAILHNVLPLISDPEHGTHFGLTGQRGPTPREVKALQDGLTGGAMVMRHCRQCRADAVGMLGQDQSQDFTMDKIDDGPAYDPEPARLYRQVVAQERADREEAGRVAGRALAGVQPAAPAKLAAVCSKGGGRINQHFGHAQEFLVFEVDGAGVRFVGHRKAGAYCRGGYGDDDRMKTILTALNGIDAVFVAKIGRCPKDELAKAGIEAIDGHAFAYIETAVATWYADRFAAAATPARAARHA